MSTWHRGSPFRDGAPRETVAGEDLTALTEAPQPDPDHQRISPVAVAPASIFRFAFGGPRAARRSRGPCHLRGTRGMSSTWAVAVWRRPSAVGVEERRTHVDS